MKMKVFIFFIALFKFSSCQFQVPDAFVEVFRPSGLRVSIPDLPGIKLFAFHGQVNQEMNGREGGTFSRDTTKAKNGRWTFYDPLAQLNVGDTLYYWTYVDYFDGKNKLGYTNDDNAFVVRELLDQDIPNRRPVTVKPTNFTTPSCISTSKNQNKCAGELIFYDNFTTFQSDLWSPEIKFAGSPDYEFVVYTDKRKNLKVTNNMLKIRPVLSQEIFGSNFVTSREEIDLGTNCTGIHGTPDCKKNADAYFILPPVASAQITTKNKWSFKFGKVEIRAKLPKGDWIYPELYLNPAREVYGPGYASGQIRIAFLPGNKKLNKYLQGGCILGSSRAGRNYGMKTNPKNDGTWVDDFHTITLVWKPDKIIVSVDGDMYGYIRAPNKGFVSEAQNLDLQNVDSWHTGTSFAPFDKEMYLVLGVGVGGHCFEDRSDGLKPWQNEEPKSQKMFYNARSQWHSTWTDASALKVDYVKVWALG